MKGAGLTTRSKLGFRVLLKDTRWGSNLQPQGNGTSLPLKVNVRASLTLSYLWCIIFFSFPTGRFHSGLWESPPRGSTNTECLIFITADGHHPPLCRRVLQEDGLKVTVIRSDQVSEERYQHTVCISRVFPCCWHESSRWFSEDLSQGVQKQFTYLENSMQSLCKFREIKWAEHWFPSWRNLLSQQTGQVWSCYKNVFFLQCIYRVPGRSNHEWVWDRTLTCFSSCLCPCLSHLFSWFAYSKILETWTYHQKQAVFLLCQTKSGELKPAMSPRAAKSCLNVGPGLNNLT